MLMLLNRYIKDENEYGVILQNTLYAVPFYLDEHITELRTTFPYGNVIVGIYSNGLTNYPDTKLLEYSSFIRLNNNQNYDLKTVAINTTGLTLGSFYWLVCISDRESNFMSYGNKSVITPLMFDDVLNLPGNGYMISILPISTLPSLFPTGAKFIKTEEFAPMFKKKKTNTFSGGGGGSGISGISGFSGSGGSQDLATTLAIGNNTGSTSIGLDDGTVIYGVSDPISFIQLTPNINIQTDFKIYIQCDDTLSLLGNNDILIQSENNLTLNSVGTQINFSAPIYNFTNQTPSNLAYFDASSNLVSLGIGTGLTVSGGNLNVTGGGSSGVSGFSGSGISGASGISGFSGSGISGFSGSGISGFSGSGISGFSGSGISGFSGSGISGFSGDSGISGSGISGFSGSGISGFSGSGISGFSGVTNRSFGITVDGQGGVVSTGQKGYCIVPYSGTIQSWTIISDASGSIVFDIWKTAGPTIPTVANTITASAKPTLSSQQTATSSSLGTWSTLAVTTGDFIGWNVDSASTITRAILSIKVV